jgi:hypothetical protein
MSRLDLRTLKISWPLQGLLVITLGLILFTYFRGEKSEAPPEATVKAASPAPGPAGVQKGTPASAQQADASEAVAATEPPPVDLFPSQNWLPPPPPPPPPPPKPTGPPPAPPLPFTVRSLWLEENGAFYIVVAGAGREFPMCANCHKQGFLHKGDVILNAYRIDEINRKEVRFVYLPSKERQTLPLGELK